MALGHTFITTVNWKEGIIGRQQDPVEFPCLVAGRRDIRFIQLIAFSERIVAVLAVMSWIVTSTGERHVSFAWWACTAQETT